MLEIIKKIREKEEERLYLLSVLEMWSKVKDQGIDPEEVKYFSFDPKLATNFQRKEINPDPFAPVGFNENNEAISSYYNVVILKTGECRELKPPIKSPKC